MPEFRFDDQRTNQSIPVRELTVKCFDDAYNSVINHPAETAIAVAAAGFTVGAMVLSRGRISPVSILEKQIATLEMPNMDSLHAGELLAAAASKMSTLEKFAWKAEQLLAKATYPVPSTQSVDVTSLDLSNAVPAVRHKISATLLSRHLEQSHEIRVPRNDVISERNLAGVYNPLLARRYSNDFGLKLLELGPSVSVAVPKTFASKLSSYTAVDFSLPSLKQQANSLSKFGQFDKQLIRADVTDTGVASGSQDLVVANSVPAFTSDPADNMTKAYEEAARVLRKDGELVVFPFTYSDQVHPLIGNMFKAVDSQQIVQGSASHLAVVFKKL